MQFEVMLKNSTESSVALSMVQKMSEAWRSTCESIGMWMMETASSSALYSQHTAGEDARPAVLSRGKWPRVRERDEGIRDGYVWSRFFLHHGERSYSVSSAHGGVLRALSRCLYIYPRGLSEDVSMPGSQAKTMAPANNGDVDAQAID